MLGRDTLAASCGLFLRVSVGMTDWSGWVFGLARIDLDFAEQGRWLRIRLMRYERFEGFLWVALVGLVLRWAGLVGDDLGVPQLSWVCLLAFCVFRFRPLGIWR